MPATPTRDPPRAAAAAPSRACVWPKTDPTAAPGGRAGRHRFLNLLPHLDTPPARTLSQSSVQENPRAQERNPSLLQHRLHRATCRPRTGRSRSDSDVPPTTSGSTTVRITTRYPTRDTSFGRWCSRTPSTGLNRLSSTGTWQEPGPGSTGTSLSDTTSRSTASGS